MMNHSTAPATLLLALSLLVGLPSIASANDAVFGGSGADLAPVKEDTLRMASEDIIITMVGPKGKWKFPHWEIQATYVFENPSDEAKAVTFGFPEQFCDPDGDCNSREGKRDVTFYGMKTTVDGKKVKVRVGEVSKKSEWAPELGRVHLFDVTVKAKSKATVVHRYEMGTSGSSLQDESLYYVTRTGALWNGPIGKARFTIRLMERPWGFHYPATYKLQSFETKPNKKGKKGPKNFTTQIVFEMKDWTPTQDLEVMLGSNLMPYFKCPSMVIDADNLVDEKGKIDLPRAKEVFAKLDKKQLRVCRNIPYAHHGYTFKDPTLNALFYTDEISEKSETSKWPYMNAGAARENHRVVSFARDKNYTPAMLTKQESDWVRIIKAVEKSRE